MRIILANYRYYISGGPEIYMFNVKEQLEKLGHEVIPYSVRCDINEPTPYSSYFPHGKSDSGDAYFNNVKKTPKNIIRLLSCAFYNKEAYANLRRLIRDTKPDVVYVLQQINALSPSIFKACKDEGIRVVHRLSDFNIMCPRSDFLCKGEVCTSCINGNYKKAQRNNCCHGSKATTAVRIASMKFHKKMNLFDNVDAFVCPTSFTAKKLIESGVDESRVCIIPTFTNIPNSVNYSNDGYALYLGRISEEKGIEYLLDAAVRYPQLQLMITGELNTDYALEMVERAKNLNLLSRVKFTGFVSGEEKNKLINNSACVVCPSTWFENMPNAVLEGFAHGKPVVAFDIGCMPELIDDGINGSIVPLGNSDALGGEIAAYMNGDLSRKCGMAARSKVEEEYSMEKHLNALIRVMQG